MNASGRDLFSEEEELTVGARGQGPGTRGDKYQRAPDRITEGVLLQRAAAEIGRQRRVSGETREVIARATEALRPELQSKVAAARGRRRVAPRSGLRDSAAAPDGTSGEGQPPAGLRPAEMNADESEGVEG